MIATRWAAVSVVAFVATVISVALLISYATDAFDPAPALPLALLADDDSNTPSRVHWVAGDTRIFRVSLSGHSGPVQLTTGDELRVVSGESSEGDPCGVPAVPATVSDGEVAVFHACIEASETTIRVSDAAGTMTLGTHRLQIHPVGTPLPAPTPSVPVVHLDKVGGVVAERVGDGAIELRWETPGDIGSEPNGYDVRRREVGSGWSWVTFYATVFHPRLLDIDDLQAGVVYEYQVRVVGHQSVGEWSEPAAAALQSPNPPASVAVAEDDTTELLDLALTWSAPAAGETPTQYGVERSVEYGPWATIHLLPATSAVKYVERASPGTFYCYRVRATNEHGSSAHAPRGGPCINVPLPTPTPIPEPTPEGG